MPKIARAGSSHTRARGDAQGVAIFGVRRRHLDLDERAADVGGHEHDFELELVGALRQLHRRLELLPPLAQEQGASKVMGVRERLPSRGVEQGQLKHQAARRQHASRERLACHRHMARR